MECLSRRFRLLNHHAPATPAAWVYRVRSGCRTPGKLPSRVFQISLSSLVLELGIEGCWVFSVAVTMIQACALWLWALSLFCLVPAG